ncbi:MAG: class I SAM-dependent methyltransferase [Chromatiales bacterium]|jgi:hypothetical protein
MISNFFRYLASLPTVLRKIAVLHQFSIFLDEATPEQLRKSLRAWRVYKREHGYLKSLVENQCLDSAGAPIPWYSYAAIEQLKKWDFTDCDVLEYGSGNSTKWWAGNARTVTSIESSKEWFEKVKQDKPENSELILSPIANDGFTEDEIGRYVDVVDTLGSFDVIVVDGFSKAGTRKRCVEKALPHLRPGGLFIVDNSDWLPITCKLLRDQGYTEIDFSGLGPLNAHAETTSLFFAADFRIKPNSHTHPGHAIGGLDLLYDVEM